MSRFYFSTLESSRAILLLTPAAAWRFTKATPSWPLRHSTTASANFARRLTAGHHVIRIVYNGGAAGDDNSYFLAASSRSVDVYISPPYTTTSLAIDNPLVAPVQCSTSRASHKANFPINTTSPALSATTTARLCWPLSPPAKVLTSNSRFPAASTITRVPNRWLLPRQHLRHGGCVCRHR